MGEFDLDLQVGGNAHGWESVFRPQQGGAPDGIRMAATNSPLGCAPTSGATDCSTCVNMTCARTCGGLTGSPCAC
jgi:hypothetical protein